MSYNFLKNLLSVKTEPNILLINPFPWQFLYFIILVVNLLWWNDSRNLLYLIGLFHQKIWLLLAYPLFVFVDGDQVPCLRLDHCSLRTDRCIIPQRILVSNTHKLACRTLTVLWLPLPGISPFQVRLHQVSEPIPDPIFIEYVFLGIWNWNIEKEACMWSV